MRKATGTARWIRPDTPAWEAWRQEAIQGKMDDDTCLVKYHHPDIKVVAAERRVRFRISTEDRDRDNDMIRVDGWDLEAYKASPVVLWAHDYSAPPVAKAVDIRVEGSALVADDVFATKEEYPFADTVFRLITGGFLRATSVGFRPRKAQYNEEAGGFDFLEQELLEHSIVPVPANPYALIAARHAGIDLAPLKEWAERILDTWYEERGIWVSRSVMETLFQQSRESTPIRVMVTAPDDTKGVSPRDVSTETAPEDTPWSAPTLGDFTDQSWDDVSAAEKRRIAGHYAWAAQMPPETFGALKLPHHRPSDGAVVWRGVANAAARLPQSTIPEEDVSRVQTHLARHYRAFDRTPPWEASAAAWQAYCAVVRAGRMTAEQMQSVLRALGFTWEADALGVPEVPEPEPEEDWKTIVAEEVRRCLQEKVTAVTGRVF